MLHQEVASNQLFLDNERNIRLHPPTRGFRPNLLHLKTQNTKHLNGVYDKYNSKPDSKKEAIQMTQKVALPHSSVYASMMIDCCTSHHCNWVQNQS